LPNVAASWACALRPQVKVVWRSAGRVEVLMTITQSPQWNSLALIASMGASPIGSLNLPYCRSNARNGQARIAVTEDTAVNASLTDTELPSISPKVVISWQRSTRP